MHSRLAGEGILRVELKYAAATLMCGDFFVPSVIQRGRSIGLWSELGATTT
jgi:hypothetical protein